MPPYRTARRVALALGAALCLSALGADEPSQTVDAGGLTLKVPKAWKAGKPSSQMRRAELTVEPSKGDKDKAELVVYVFRGDVGGLDANVRRWESMFQDKDGKPAKAKTEARKVGKVEVTVVEVAGRYVAAVSPGAAEKHDKPDYRFLGAYVPADGRTYTLRMVGPDRTMKDAKADFDAMIKSIKVED